MFLIPFHLSQDAISSRTGWCEDLAEPDSAPRSWHSCPGKEERSSQHISWIGEVSGVSTFSGPLHTKRSSFSHVSHIFFHPQSSSSFPSLIYWVLAPSLLQATVPAQLLAEDSGAKLLPKASDGLRRNTYKCILPFHPLGDIQTPLRVTLFLSPV